MNIFMIDNNYQLCQDIKKEILDRDINNTFTYSQDLETGLRDIKENINEIDLIILDGKGYLSKEDTKEKAVHVVRGISNIRTLSKTIQIVIYTGFLDDVEEQITDIVNEKITIYDKSEVDIKEFSNILEERINNSDFYLIKTKYSDLFSLFDDGFLDKTNSELYNGFILNVQVF